MTARPELPVRTVGAAEIEALQRRAADLGDGETVEDCGKALQGSHDSALWCERVIRGERSQECQVGCTCEDCAWIDQYQAAVT